MLEKESNSRQEEKGEGGSGRDTRECYKGPWFHAAKGGGGDPGGWAPRILSHLVFFFWWCPGSESWKPPMSWQDHCPNRQGLGDILGPRRTLARMADGQGVGAAFPSQRARETGRHRPWVRLESSVERVRPLGAPLMLSKLDARQRSWFAGWPRDKRAGPWPNGGLGRRSSTSYALGPYWMSKTPTTPPKTQRGRSHSGCVACQQSRSKRGLAIARHDRIPASKAPSGSWPGERRASLPE